MDLISLKAKWVDCKRCNLSKYRRNMIFGRGHSNKPDILFIGPPPVRVEDLLGKPYVDSSNKLLDITIDSAMSLVKIRELSIYKTNIIGCRPTDSKGGANREPTKEECTICSQRLLELIDTLKPRKIIFISKLVEKHCKKIIDGVGIGDLSKLIKNGGTKGPEFRVIVRTLSEVFKKDKKRRIICRKKKK